MQLPPNLSVDDSGLVTNVAANTVTTGTLVAAPGAAFRLRLWGVAIIPSLTSQAVVNWRAYWTNALAGPAVAVMSGATFAGGSPVWIPGGYALLTNTLLGYSHMSALASMQLHMLSYYTIEAV